MCYTYQIPIPNIDWFRPTVSGGSKATFENICEEVAAQFNVQVSDLRNKSKRGNAAEVQARWVFWKIMFSMEYTKVDCAKMLNAGFDHTAVIHGLNRLREELATNERLKANYTALMHLDKKPYDLNKLHKCQ